ncbi:hypothetical protein [Oscillibacter sp.]|uniref:hypothetical protein n=1 Tax=Oscillibacter sp. TaxID=1945593 RepID=UPI0028A2B49E|nr:hypothetical protein [Oscillibacter sp.]
MMEVIRKKMHKGSEIQIWCGTDAEGRKIYSVSDASDIEEPTGGLYSQKAALDSYYMSCIENRIDDIHVEAERIGGYTPEMNARLREMHSEIQKYKF